MIHMNNTDTAIVRCYIPTLGRHYEGPDERTIVEWSEYPPEMMPPHFTQEAWDEAGGPDCLKNKLAVAVDLAHAQQIAKEKATLPSNYGGVAMIYRQKLDIYARDRVDLGHWETVGEGEEVTA